MNTLFSFFGRDHKGRSTGGTRYTALRPHALTFMFLTSIGVLSAQEVSKDSVKTQPLPLDEVIISAIRADDKMPVTFSNMSKKEIAKRNLGQDIPILMNFMPSVVTTSDAGAGIGYTGIRVRGSDATRVNVTVNGIPYNDSESHGTFWVNMPDFASSVQSLQLQRGVGTSTNGSGAFGASLNMLTDSYSHDSNGEISNSFGSFNTRKHTVKFSTGLINDQFELAGRLSNIASDGFIDRAKSNLKSYFLQGTYVNGNTLIKALAFGGNQQTYQAWNGVEDLDKIKNNRTYNPSGEYIDDNGNVKYYDNENDQYQQDHYQLHWNERLNDNWSSNLALHYTRGSGFYENYKVNQKLVNYGLEPGVNPNGSAITKSDLIRRKWLKNEFWGTTFSINYKDQKTDFVFGGGANKYEGAHFGNVLWTRKVVLPEYNFKYYNDNSVKTDVNVFAKLNYDLSDKWRVFGDLQYRNVGYSANGVETGMVDDNFNFFNPKAGITYVASERGNIYFSFARAQREPNRNDYKDGSPRPEKLNDFELGYRFASATTKFNVNGYYMRYKDQLVLTGELNDVGGPIRENSGDSYRLGIEIDAEIKINDKFKLRPNMTISSNKNENFVFERDGVLQNLGTTNIAFSPDIIVGNIVTFSPTSNLQMSLLTKFVSEQYMGNIDSKASILQSYSVSDFSISYEIKPKSIFKSIVITGMANNIFDYKYESNGFFYTFDDDETNPGSIQTIEGAGYYPQAGINFLAGLTLTF